ncbi:2-keto-4-pentenoate hydratase [Collimonas arenae]|uniref:2-keto-4-pentenoate hydratase n=1 Tax=Collimonas arenae TaxID=279058 RepID=A0A0A1F6D1_9BURK|nr:fumarylacetoacetate hydrolase family protein [Collimonas arenae]AIY39350.1 2-keto-4-pentenoate hydratase [Collimonas arenae]
MQAHTPQSQAAAILAARRQLGEQGPRLPLHLRPQDVEAALAIQAQVTEHAGDRIGAWKCGLPVEGQPVVAPIYAGTIYDKNPCLAWTRGGQVRVEPELAFVLGHDLPARAAPYTAEEVDAAIASTHLALELIDSRYTEPDAAGFIENLADGLLNQGLYLGPQVDMAQARSASELAICISTGDSDHEVTRLQGRHPAVHPRAPLYWLAEFLRSTGRGLRAGQAVITGSYAGSFDLPPAQEITIHYGELGQLNVLFTPR